MMENDLGFTTALHDKGLDGFSGSEELVLFGIVECLGVCPQKKCS
jgi:hypothetical protein